MQLLDLKKLSPARRRAYEAAAATTGKIGENVAEYLTTALIQVLIGNKRLDDEDRAMVLRMVAVRITAIAEELIECHESVQS